MAVTKNCVCVTCFNRLEMLFPETRPRSTGRKFGKSLEKSLNYNNRNWLPLTQAVFCIQLYATTTRKSGAELRQNMNTDTNTDKSLLMKTDLQMVR